MKYLIYQFHFRTGVRFGNKSLADTDISFCADTLLSALCQEALLQEGEAGIRQLYDWADHGELVLSDAMPFCGSDYYIPKPLLPVQKRKESPGEKKDFKRLRVINYKQLSSFAGGTYDISKKENKAQPFGRVQMDTKVAVHPGRDSEPYEVASFHFQEGAGLYVILGYASEEIKDALNEWIDSLSATGIGGRRSSGLGKFDVSLHKLPKDLEARLSGTYSKYLLLTTSMAADAELEEALEGASYLLKKRSGFVDSQEYTSGEHFLKKKEMYMFQPGSCFQRPFHGEIYDVSVYGAHPVYRYGKGMFMGI